MNVLEWKNDNFKVQFVWSSMSFKTTQLNLLLDILTSNGCHKLMRVSKINE